MTEETCLLIVPHTHWDREWYLTFQQFRMRLVRTVDNVLDALESDPAYTFFMLDGQTIVLEDYLEIRPENRERLQKLARQGRILVGPWYLQPDEFLVSGESLIRNLQAGYRMAADFGGAMPIGYVPDTFGHIAQLPQILRGFGLDNAVFWRGVPKDIQSSAFHWAAPDGSAVLVAWLNDDFGYSNAAILPIQPDALAARLILIADRMRPGALTNTLLLMNGTDHIEPQPGLPAALDAARARLAERGIEASIATLPHYLSVLREAGLSLPTYTGEMRGSFSAHLLPGVLSMRMWLKQHNAAGEALLTRWAEPAAAWAWLYGAKHPTALLRRSWRYLLHNHPHDSICGCSIDQVHREMMPRFAQSEQIAEELTTQALRSLGEHIETRGSERAIPLVVFNPGPGPRTDVAHCEAQPLFPDFEIVDSEGHPLPYQALSAPGTALFDETADKDFTRSMMGMIEGGRALGYSILDGRLDGGDDPGTVIVRLTVSERAAPNVELVERLKARILALAEREDVAHFRVIAHEATRVQLLLLARDVPTFGGRVLFLRPKAESGVPDASVAQSDAPLSWPADSQVRAGFASLENTHLKVTIEPSTGTLTLLDKRTGHQYAGLNRVADGGDVGDLYTYCPPAADTLVMEPAWPPSIAIAEHGPARATLRIARTYALPAACAPDRAARAGERVHCAVVSEVSLTAGARRVEIRTTVENTARDHRLRILFPVPFVAEMANAEGTFEVTRRAARHPELSPEEAARWFELPVNTQPQKRFVDLSNGEHGLAVLNRGLPEYEVLGWPEGGGSAIALTLLRCVEWLSRNDLSTRRNHAGPPLQTPEAQGLGTHVFEYALVPHAGMWHTEDAFVQQEANAYEAPLRAVATTQHAGEIPTSWSFAHVAPGSVAVSAIKRAEDEDALVLRLYNPRDVAMDADVILPLPFREVERVNLNEEPIHDLSAAKLARILSTGVRTRLQGGEIVTLLFRFDVSSSLQGP
jgi:alpha-mannosidase